MKITFLGSGAAFTLGNWQSNILIEENGKRLLLDCGGDIRWSLHEQNLNFLNIDAVYVSHLHGDHVGGLEGLAFSTYFCPMKKRPRLIASEDVANDLWDKSLRGGLESLECQTATLDTFFDVEKVPDNGHFFFEGICFDLIQVVHILNNHVIVPSFGLAWEANDKKIFFTSDTQFCPNQIHKIYEWADIIYHDCETMPCRSGVHSHYLDLRTLSEDIKKKMYLYHWNGFEENLPDCKADGFAGFVKKGNSWDI